MVTQRIKININFKELGFILNFKYVKQKKMDLNKILNYLDKNLINYERAKKMSLNLFFNVNIIKKNFIKKNLIRTKNMET